MTTAAKSAGQRDKRATIRDVAKHAGVSVATVSRVLAGNYPAAPATRAKVMKAVRELDYVVNAHARALAGHSARMVAILLQSVASPFYAAVAEGVEEQAAREGRLCLISSTGGDPERELASVRLLREQGAEAVILVGGVVESADYKLRMAQYAQALEASNSKLVLCGRPPLGNDVSSMLVDYDNEGGAYAATSYLLSVGHERIAFVGGVTGMTTANARTKGWQRAIEDRDLSMADMTMLTGGNGQGFGYSSVAEHLKLTDGSPGFTALLAYDDDIAAGAIMALHEADLDVPGDVSVVGYNDNPMAAHMAPPLTTVHVPAAELGRTAVQMALHPDTVSAGSREAHLGTHIVVRDSVAPPR